MLDRLPDIVLLQTWECLGPAAHSAFSNDEGCPLCTKLFHVHTGSFPRFENVPYLPFIASATQNTRRYIHIASAIQILSVEDLLVGRVPKTPLPLDSVLLEALLQPLKALPDQVCWWREVLEAGRKDTWFSILLLQLPNLRKLELKYLDTISSYPQFASLAIDNYKLPSFTEEGDATDLLDASSLCPILPLYQSYFHSDLTHLTLHGCSTIATLPGLLTRLPKLKSLIYRHNDSGLPQVKTPATIDHTNQDAGINTSMRQASPVARTQHVATSTPINILNPAELTLGTVERSFRMKGYERRVFHSLRQVRIRFQNGIFSNVWVGNDLWDVLPLSLEGLFLEDCDRGIMPVLASQLRQVLESQVGTKEYVLFPVMETVVLQQPIDEVDRVPFGSEYEYLNMQLSQLITSK
ncbi:hypothetical protein BO83DRAFT_463436 [Aspergillus eucalypticola CBS 122712]|uniref:Uncharacterized protein n=1 Tax=Aspergillus eucalypticola (strain CBS 122712 / IBT 29274) TaxID=1448314 RepID=A0A317VRW1_ASPEC|nr:uncharacterized protein BO83DRAFT_463436 [Aspergillus eucalypticola CBS 122712]PWY75747.1 hypothetical protein BO83DRAFT_463436 [Aspergillus eucalypticola CBS 122712]